MQVNSKKPSNQCETFWSSDKSISHKLSFEHSPTSGSNIWLTDCSIEENTSNMALLTSTCLYGYKMHQNLELMMMLQLQTSLVRYLLANGKLKTRNCKHLWTDKSIGILTHAEKTQTKNVGSVIHSLLYYRLAVRSALNSPTVFFLNENQMNWGSKITTLLASKHGEKTWICSLFLMCMHVQCI